MDKDAEGNTLWSYCMLGAMAAAGGPVGATNVASNLLANKGRSIGRINDNECHTKEDAIGWLDKLIDEIE
jgi:hypothetical protein